jgi:ribulose 1,5-bisphosphate carboxylase large subunit-like protein|tara:strand:+ start:333 stop:494 length:162 start_codon:yes stop_codon:yes gene_type:complete
MEFRLVHRTLEMAKERKSHHLLMDVLVVGMASLKRARTVHSEGLAKEHRVELE